jgi:hypothetical protein
MYTVDITAIFFRGKSMRLTSAILFFLSVAISSDAATTVVTNQPPVYADREVSQDATVAGCGGQTRIVNVELAFTATPSNNVQIAFGTDLNNDGRLSFGEVRVTLGWDCGKWFIASGDQTQQFTYPPVGASTGSVFRTLKMPMRLNAAGVPLALSFADGSSPFTFENLTTVPAWVRPREWSLLRLTARGWDGRDEQALVKMSLDGNVIFLR